MFRERFARRRILRRNAIRSIFKVRLHFTTIYPRGGSARPSPRLNPGYQTAARRFDDPDSLHRVLIGGAGRARRAARRGAGCAPGRRGVGCGASPTPGRRPRTTGRPPGLCSPRAAARAGRTRQCPASHPRSNMAEPPPPDEGLATAKVNLYSAQPLSAAATSSRSFCRSRLPASACRLGQHVRAARVETKGYEKGNGWASPRCWSSPRGHHSRRESAHDSGRGFLSSL